MTTEKYNFLPSTFINKGPANVKGGIYTYSKFSYENRQALRLVFLHKKSNKHVFYVI
jgi:hypothetical protein